MTLDTSSSILEESLAEFVEKMTPLMAQSDRLRIQARS